MAQNKQLLRLVDLPVCSNLREFCDLAHFDRDRLCVIANEAYRFYRRYDIPKKSGGARTIFQPTAEVKAIQRWILRNILDKLKPSSAATAFVRKLRLTDNVRPHRQNRYFLCVDLEDFFPSISRYSVFQLYRVVGYNDRMAEWLTKLCTVNGFLPQGAITSPALSNLVSLRLDRRLMGLSAARGIVFTRYADDLTFSSNNPALLRKTYPLVREIVIAQRLTVNERKVRFSGPDSRCDVTGLVKNSDKAAFGIGRAKFRQLRAEIFALQSGKTPIFYKTEESIRGFLSFSKSVDPSSTRKLEDYWTKLRARLANKGQD